MSRPDYLGKLLVAIDKVRPWNGAVILMPGTDHERTGWISEYAINPMPMFHATSYIGFLTRHTRDRRCKT